MAIAPLKPTGVKREQEEEETGWHTNPDAQFDVLPSIDIHAWVEQAEFAKVVAVGHEGAANHGRSPAMTKTQQYENKTVTRNICTCMCVVCVCGFVNANQNLCLYAFVCANAVRIQMFNIWTCTFLNVTYFHLQFISDYFEFKKKDKNQM